MRKELSQKEKLFLTLRNYGESRKDITSQIETYGPNNHLVNLEYYFDTKVESLKKRLKDLNR